MINNETFLQSTAITANSRIDAVLIAFILCYNTGADLIVCAF